MSTLKGKIGRTDKGEDNSSVSENSSDGEYELLEIKPQVYNSKSSSTLRRQRKVCCSTKCWVDWAIVIAAYLLLYLVNGLFTWALIEAMLSNTDNTLITFACIWLVFVLIFFPAVIYLSNQKLKEREAQAEMAIQQEQKRRDNIKAALEKEN